MRIAKYFENDARSKLVSMVFDRAIRSFYFNWNLDKLSIFITEGSNGDAWVDGTEGKIFIGKDNHYIKEMDEGGIDLLVMQKLHLLILKMRGLDTQMLRNEFHQKDGKLFDALLRIENFLALREMAKKFPQAVFCHMIKEINRIDASDEMASLGLGLGWLAFYGIDQWDMDFLEKTSRKKIHPNFDETPLDNIIKMIDDENENDTETLRKIIISIGYSLNKKLTEP